MKVTEGDSVERDARELYRWRGGQVPSVTELSHGCFKASDSWGTHYPDLLILHPPRFLTAVHREELRKPPAVLVLYHDDVVFP